MSDRADLSRRAFLTATGAVVAGSLLAGGLSGCGDSAPSPAGPQGTTGRTKAYMLSGRNRRVSGAALLHNHNMVFVSPEAADGCRAHDGDNSRVVRIDIGPKQWSDWFGSGATKVDLRTRS